MKSGWIKLLCRFLVASMLMMSFGAANAGMIGADQVAAGGLGDRAIVMSTLDRADISNGLRSQGVDPQAAKDRVAAMTDEEVSTLKGRLDALPAGGAYGGGGGGSSGGWVIAAVVIIIAVIVWYNWK